MTFLQTYTFFGSKKIFNLTLAAVEKFETVTCSDIHAQ